jgi:hypothetical protein
VGLLTLNLILRHSSTDTPHTSSIFGEANRKSVPSALTNDTGHGTSLISTEAPWAKAPAPVETTDVFEYLETRVILRGVASVNENVDEAAGEKLSANRSTVSKSDVDNVEKSTTPSVTSLRADNRMRFLL